MALTKNLLADRSEDRSEDDFNKYFTYLPRRLSNKTADDFVAEINSLFPPTRSVATIYGKKHVIPRDQIMVLLPPPSSSILSQDPIEEVDEKDNKEQPKDKPTHSSDNPTHTSNKPTHTSNKPTYSSDKPISSNKPIQIASSQSDNDIDFSFDSQPLILSASDVPDVPAVSAVSVVPAVSAVSVVSGGRQVQLGCSAGFDQSLFSYEYSNMKVLMAPYTPAIAAVRHEVEELSKSSYNVVLINRYLDGKDGVGWHADDEKTINQTKPIASVSLGCARDFDVRRKKPKSSGNNNNNTDNNKRRWNLRHRDVLIMNPGAQQRFEQTVPKLAKVLVVRYNLTIISCSL